MQPARIAHRASALGRTTHVQLEDDVRRRERLSCERKLSSGSAGRLELGRVLEERDADVRKACALACRRAEIRGEKLSEPDGGRQGRQATGSRNRARVMLVPVRVHVRRAKADPRPVRWLGRGPAFAGLARRHVLELTVFQTQSMADERKM
jgi:hypothetical protein